MSVVTHRSAEEIGTTPGGPRPLPPLGVTREVPLPDVTVVDLPSGLRVLVARRSSVPMVELRLRVPFADPSPSAGSAHPAVAEHVGEVRAHHLRVRTRDRPRPARARHVDTPASTAMRGPYPRARAARRGALAAGRGATLTAAVRRGSKAAIAAGLSVVLVGGGVLVLRERAARELARDRQEASAAAAQFLQAWTERGAVTSTSDPRGTLLPAKRHDPAPTAHTGRYAR